MPITRLKFQDDQDMNTVEETILLAFLCVSCIHGEPALVLSCGYLTSAEKRSVVIRWSGKCGDDLIRMAIGLCVREFGSDSFKVEDATAD